MKKLFLCLVTTFIYCSISLGYSLEVQINGLENETIIIGHHYGADNKIIGDIELNKKGRGSLSEQDILSPGLYFIMLPSKKYIEFLVNREQDLYIFLDIKNIQNSLIITGSEDSKLYNKYQKQMYEFQQISNNYQEKIKEFKYNNDSSAKYKMKVKNLDSLKISYTKKLVNENPGTFTSILLKATLLPEFPHEYQRIEKNLHESFLEKLNFYRTHYFDNIDLTDERLVNTPILYTKVYHYFDRILQQDPGIVILEIDKFIKKIESSTLLYKFTLSLFWDMYSTQKEMEPVVLHLAKDYYLAGKTPWVDQDFLNHVNDKVERINNMSVGKKIKNEVFISWGNDTISLNDLENKQTILYFWMSTCNYCKIVTPKIIQLITERNLQVLAIYSGNKDEMIESAYEYPKNWVNVYYPGSLKDLETNYDLINIPTIHLVEKDWVLKNKHLSIHELEDFIKIDEL